MQVARELKIHIEAVPLEEFIPLPKGNADRIIHIGQFGNLKIYVAEPYSIALSKLDRGADTDYDDIIFLIQNNYVNKDELERITTETRLRARQFDLHPDILEHLQELKNRLK